MLSTTCLLSMVFISATRAQDSFGNLSTGNNGSVLYKPLYPVHSNSTPRFYNVSGSTANPMVKPLLGPSGNGTLQKRDELPTGTCAPGTPCVNGACCSNTGICGYSPDECGTDVCISNCDAKAECGQYGVDGQNICPINVCCSKFGFCGTTDDFCLDECQQGFGGCGPVNQPSCSGLTAGRTVGYYEGWSSKRDCDIRLPSDIDISALTHINFAFAFFHPTTFEITPMNPDDIKLYPQFTALKKKKASLQTWIAVGGWSFNDATNIPNTQKAFSDMASTEATRKQFIDSLLKFMNTYGFNGIDIDWEYPGAPDRGGTAADTQNFVHLLTDLKTAFGNTYGISVTLPASYWYLRWFDIVGMADYVDFFNVMTYDIHGVWDSSNKNTGPYVRPHTNLTEITEGLDLLWRNGIDPKIVNLGIGWYGRSFTLRDASCTSPGCVFSSGGTPGECTKSSGTLSNAEISRIMKQKALTPQWDEQAGVKWLAWDDQWVSYDDGQTMAQKMDLANRLCLGGKLIWAVDLDDENSTSTLDVMGLGTSNGVTPEIAQEIKTAQLKAEVQATVRNSCYWSFCGEGCVPGYFGQTTAKGQVLGIQRDGICRGDEVQTLCCAPGTNTGTCEWRGFRGVGLSCGGSGCQDDESLVAVNTNQYALTEDTNRNYTCNGGTQSYCCRGFVPSPKQSTDDLTLVGQNGVTKRAVTSKATDPTCQKAAATGSIIAGGLLSLISGPLGIAVGILGIVGSSLPCQKSGAAGAAGGAVGVVPWLQVIGTWAASQSTVTMTTTETVVPLATATVYGQWGTKASFTGNDCHVTYTCRYGMGWDEICDNQRWGVDMKLGGQTVFQMRTDEGPPARASVAAWRVWRKEAYRSLAQTYDLPYSTARCQVVGSDEFPMGALVEGNAGQALRLVNGRANGAQGNDFGSWIIAVWEPCRVLRALHSLPPPPVTWAFGSWAAGDARGIATDQHFIQKYGFDSQTAGSLCWATYSKGSAGAQGATTVQDHGFRVYVDDPMFDWPFRYPRQRYDVEPLPASVLGIRPENVAFATWLRRSNVKLALSGDIPTELANADFDVCEVEGHFVPCSTSDEADATSQLASRTTEAVDSPALNSEVDTSKAIRRSDIVVTLPVETSIPRTGGGFD